MEDTRTPVTPQIRLRRPPLLREAPPPPRSQGLRPTNRSKIKTRVEQLFLSLVFANMAVGQTAKKLWGRLSCFEHDFYLDVLIRPMAVDLNDSPRVTLIRVAGVGS